MKYLPFEDLELLIIVDCATSVKSMELQGAPLVLNPQHWPVPEAGLTARKAIMLP
jgi:hypothetical protein